MLLNQVWRHKLGAQQSEDVLLYHEKNEEFFIYFYKSESGEFLFLCSATETTQFVLYMKVDDPSQEFRSLTPQVTDTDFFVSHRGEHFLIEKRNNESYNSELLVCHVDSVSDTTVLLQHRPRYIHLVPYKLIT